MRRDGLKGHGLPAPHVLIHRYILITVWDTLCLNQHWPPQNQSCLAWYLSTVAPTSDPQMPTRPQVTWENGLCLPTEGWDPSNQPHCGASWVPTSGRPRAPFPRPSAGTFTGRGWGARAGETMRQAWPPTGQYLHVSATARGAVRMGDTSEQTGRRDRAASRMEQQPPAAAARAGLRWAPRRAASPVTRPSEHEAGLHGTTPGVSVRTHLHRQKPDQMAPGSPQPPAASSPPRGHPAPSLWALPFLLPLVRDRGWPGGAARGSPAPSEVTGKGAPLTSRFSHGASNIGRRHPPSVECPCIRPCSRRPAPDDSTVRDDDVAPQVLGMEKVGPCPGPQGTGSSLNSKANLKRHNAVALKFPKPQNRKHVTYKINCLSIRK